MRHQTEADMGKIIPFDTLAYAKKLESRGVAMEQAQAHAEVLAEVLEVNFSTKQETYLATADIAQKVDNVQNQLTTFQHQTTAEFSRVTAEFNSVTAEFTKVRSEIKELFAQKTTALIRWTMGVALTQLTLIIAASKVFH